MANAYINKIKRSDDSWTFVKKHLQPATVDPCITCNLRCVEN